MVVGLLTVELHIPYSQSLKDKRVLLNRIRDKVRKKFNVAVAEVDYHEKWQRSLVAMTTVSGQASHVDEVLQKTFQMLDNDPDYEIISYQFEYR